MLGLLEGDSGRNLIGLATIILLFGWPVILGVMAIWLKHQRQETRDQLIQDMVAAGMSADEITQVLNAANSKEKKDKSTPDN